MNKNYLKELLKTFKEKQEKRQTQEIINSFNVTEKNGKLYIMSGMRAVEAISPDMSAEDIICLLNKCRKAHLDYTKNE